MSHLVWSTKEGRRIAALGRAARWPLIGAAIAGGALAVVAIFGRRAARELGREGGEAFAEGVNRIQAQLQGGYGGRGSRWG